MIELEMQDRMELVREAQDVVKSRYLLCILVTQRIHQLENAIHFLVSVHWQKYTHQQADMCCRTYWGVLPKLWPKTFRHRRCRQTLSKCPSKSMHDIVIFPTDTNHNLVATEMTVGIHCGSNCWATPSTNFGNMLAK